MINFLPCRGFVFVIKEKGGGEGSFRMDPELTGTDKSPILMQSLQIDEQVINLPVNTLDGARILYIFGKSWGNIAVGGLALLGEGSSGDALAKVVDYYKENETSTSDGTCKVSLPAGKAYSFYLTGLSIGNPDAEFQFFPFTLIGKIVRVK